MFWKILDAEYVEHVYLKRFEGRGGLRDRKKMFSHNLTYIATLTKGILDDLDDATLGDRKKKLNLLKSR